MKKVVLGFWLVVLCLLSANAYAKKETDADREAKERYRRGTQLFDTGRFLEAEKEFEAAFELSGRPDLLYNIGQAYRLAGKRQEAIAAYRGLIRRAPSSRMRPDAEARITELEKEELSDERMMSPTFDDTSVVAPPAITPQAPTPPPTVAIVEPPPVERKPRHTRAWVWGAVAGVVVVVGLSVGLGVGLGVRSHAPSSDEKVTF